MIQNIFLPGDKWLYFNLYAGPKTVDSLIIEVLPELIQELKSRGLIEKWFFIRYNIPEFHLRLRFYNGSPGGIGKLFTYFHSRMIEWKSIKYFYKIQVDSYKREIDRYGEGTMELAEQLFNCDSDLIMEYLQLSSEIDKGDNFRWLFAILVADQYMDSFNLNNNQKIEFIQKVRNSFWREFGLGRQTKKQIDVLYREKSNLIQQFISGTNINDKGLLRLYKLIKSHKSRVNIVTNEVLLKQENFEMTVDINSFLASIVHMTMNRIFVSKNRLHEVVCYDFMLRYYVSRGKRIPKL